MRERHLMLLAWMSYLLALFLGKPRLAHLSTKAGHHKEATHGLALFTWQAHAFPKPHHDRPLEEATPLGLALMNPHSRLPSLAPLASQGLHTSP
ncbi:hypothetical protein TIFTF001_053439 [Ficus carica]|uniref:Secreted protein n=1 Tax=Ficus carica TaxID=3494 RepID=A0AA88EC93_FICCA|nr:hypothetical protein TIFTF001_053439 [Ficus carica]